MCAGTTLVNSTVSWLMWQETYTLQNVSGVEFILTHCDRYKIAILQMTFSNAFSWIKSVWISLEISLKFVPRVRINIITILVQIMGWRRPGDRALSGPMVVSLLTYMCVTRPQWVNGKVICVFYNLIKDPYSNPTRNLVRNIILTNIDPGPRHVQPWLGQQELN